MVLKVGDSVNYVDMVCEVSVHKISKVGRVYAYFGKDNDLRVDKEDDPKSAKAYGKYGNWSTIVGHLTHD